MALQVAIKLETRTVPACHDTRKSEEKEHRDCAISTTGTLCVRVSRLEVEADFG